MMCCGETFPYFLSGICSRALCIESVIHHWVSRALLCEQSQNCSIASSLRGSIPGRGTSALPRMVQVLLSTNIPFPHSLPSPSQVASSLTPPAAVNIDQNSSPREKKWGFLLIFHLIWFHPRRQ